MTTIERAVPTGQVHGEYDDRFAPVIEEFVRNFAERREVGASLCITHDARTVVDVWGGTADAASSRPWTSETMSIVYSCTKGATALCAHVLASQGKLDIEAPVAEYWPEFAVRGKERATVRMMLDHSVGVPVFRDPVERGEFYDWDRVIDRLEAEQPFWEPGTRNGYHMINFGWTVGELVRRVAGQSLGSFFRTTIAEPLGLDFWIGLPESLEGRVAPMIPYVRSKGEPLSEFALTLLNEPTSIPALAVANMSSANANSREYHAAEIGGAGGITNARGLAGMYTPLAAGDAMLVDTATLQRMRRVSSATNCDATLRMATRFALGFMVRMDNRDKRQKDSVVIPDGAFGHVGAGGSIGFADPAQAISFGYTMNRMGPGILLNERGQSLIDATYRVFDRD